MYKAILSLFNFTQVQYLREELESAVHEYAFVELLKIGQVLWMFETAKHSVIL